MYFNGFSKAEVTKTTPRVNMSETEVKGCTVERVVYYNDENGYCIVKCYAKNYSKLVTIAGHMPEPTVGSTYDATGKWVNHRKFGLQFNATKIMEVLPVTILGIERYLGSGMVAGLGRIYAKNIVKKFGENTLRIIDEEPERLLEVDGIGKKRAEKISNSWKEQKKVRNLILFLNEYDIHPRYAAKIYNHYGDKSVEIIQENPYRLADDIYGIGFQTADNIAKKLGIEHDKYIRLRAGLLYTLNKLAESGNCYAERGTLLSEGEKLLTVEKEYLSMTLDEMIHQQDVILGDIRVREASISDNETYISPAELKPIYLPAFYYSEKGVARRLSAIYQTKTKLRINAKNAKGLIEENQKVKYDEIQLSAIKAAIQNKVFILTGGPGTGKTTTTLGIITAFRRAGARVLLAAPTGRAAKRLSEATGMEAKTIHRLLEASPPNYYARNEDYQLDGDVLIVDECSMIDTVLLYNLLKAVPDTMTVIMVGDVDQLPSVGAGNVLKDIIESGCFPVVELKRIFRQAQKSKIITNAHKINKGEFPELNGGKNSDFFFVDMENPKNISVITDTSSVSDMTAKKIVQLVRGNLPNYYHIKPQDIQVLTPMKKGNAGVENLNIKLQEALNPGSGGIKYGLTCFRKDDKVMQIRNDYDTGVFNGDTGVVVSVNTEEGTLIVDFDGVKVEYSTANLSDIVLAYATTIHKSQGSEYPIVVMPILNEHYIMLQRNLLYTGITRAKNVLVLVGTKKAIAYAISNNSIEKRNTMLKDYLQAVLRRG